MCGKPVLVSFRLNNDLLLNLILLPDDSCRNVISFIQMGNAFMQPVFLGVLFNGIMIHLYLNNKRLMQQNGNEHCNQKENTSIGIGRSFKTIDGCNKIGHLIQSFAVVLQRFKEVS